MKTRLRHRPAAEEAGDDPGAETIEERPGSAAAPPDRPINPMFGPRGPWARNRHQMESQNLKTKRYGGRSKHHWRTLMAVLRVFAGLLKITGLWQRGHANALDLQLVERDLFFEHLPPAFDGFTILHLSDLHLDGMPGLERRILKILGDRQVDLCVLTGDYRAGLHGPFKKLMKAMAVLLAGIRSRHGIVGVLGNHDDCHMVTPLEDLGLRLLINESLVIEKDDRQLRIIGTDDVHYYYTDQALDALERAGEAFSIALIHSPELYDVAEEAGVDLYLCGHTHGGQICLPFGIPILTHLNHGRRYFRGHWRYGRMQGITHTGVGTSGIPIRFNTRGELLVLRLRRGRPPGEEGRDSAE